MTENISCIILAAGKGTRMKSNMPKVMHLLAGQPIIKHIINTAEQMGAQDIVTVIAPGMDTVANAVEPHKTAIQYEQLGTGHAVKSALPQLSSDDGYTLILLGDVPLITPPTLGALIEAATETGLSVLGTDMPNPTGYGRLVTDGIFVNEIVEDRDCSPEQREITLVNSGCFCVATKHLAKFLDEIQNNNAQGEFYLTDIVSVAAQHDVQCVFLVAPNHEVMGINSRSQLAEAEAELQNYLRALAMHNGATLRDPMTTYFSVDTILGQDVVIEPGVVFGPEVVVGNNVTIHAYSYLEGVKIDDDVSVGPFARVRPGSHIESGASLGNFAELNRSTLKSGAKSKHMSYLGDATIGSNSNIGAGTVIANYDGFNKPKTVLNENVFVGSNSTLVAPLTVNSGAYIAAGSTITNDVPADALAIGRARTSISDGWAKNFRETNKKG